ncbi:MAG: hypothetical protein KDE53_32570, partial [Caldilineaceae bacterium]|nr:hypothetical protein [Caldilineaceae bacterium]
MNQQRYFPNRSFSWRYLGLTLALGTAIAVSACGGSTLATNTNGAAQPTATEVSASGDVPDNAVFVDYQSKDGGYSVQYVEGWSVKPGDQGGVSITDIDSAEVVELRDAPAGDLTQYVTGTDELQLQSQVQDYKQSGLKTMTVNNQSVVELTYTSTSAPNAVTNKSQ